MALKTIRRDSCLDALGNPLRRSILRSLVQSSPRSVAEISVKYPVSRPAISKHLKILSQAGLLRYVRRGNQNLYELDARGFEAAKEWLEGFWDEALTNFAAFAEGGKGRKGR